MSNTYKRDELLRCVLSNKSKHYLSKEYKLEEIYKLSEDEVDDLYSRYIFLKENELAKSLSSTMMQVLKSCVKLMTYASMCYNFYVCKCIIITWVMYFKYLSSC